MDEQLEKLRIATEELEEVVSIEDSDVGLWEQVLERREQVMQDIEILLQAGNAFTPNQKERLSMMNEINLSIFAQMNLRKDDLKKKIEKIQQNKTVRQFYNNGGTTAYGSFIDRRK